MPTILAPRCRCILCTSISDRIAIVNGQKTLHISPVIFNIIKPSKSYNKQKESRFSKTAVLQIHTSQAPQLCPTLLLLTPFKRGGLCFLFYIFLFSSKANKVIKYSHKMFRPIVFADHTKRCCWNNQQPRANGAGCIEQQFDNALIGYCKNLSQIALNC